MIDMIEITEMANSLLRKELKEPYPGLRPFLDHEHDLLMGRREQIDQVIDRLRQTHFVAIIGGSGSGKSSLIRAGVVPQLRAYAIPEAGDYWIPVVFTPGTTKAVEQASQDGANDVETPVTRLAWKFAQVMQLSKDGKVNLRLRDEVAAYLRQEAGFNRLVNNYHKLLPRPGPDTKKARFLFVIDQFEELFHPNNRDDPDTRLIIEAVIEHFRDPDPRAYVVMTMRSEHLADCAAYLNLPDAINRSFYLVRRLNNAELRDVITEPAQVMQRLVQRQDPERTAPVLFDPPVIARLLADARRIEDDPDHLPLLQHLLARVWAAALAREARPPAGDVPTAVTMSDLEVAVAPGPPGATPGWLVDDRKLNALRSSLENWAEHLYLRERSEAQRVRIDELLAKLAYKDPNNGLYFQQRVNVDDPRLLQGIAAPRQALRDLLDNGFIDGVNYLFWDKENPDHVTLKVSHEAFIRGWPRFRRVVDHEAERFEEFVAVLRRCTAWHDGDMADHLLLEAAEIERIKLDRLLPVFADEHQCKDWFAVLKLYREGERLVKTEGFATSFIERSVARQQRLHNEAQSQAAAFKAAEDAARNLAEQGRIAAARYQADLDAGRAKLLQMEAEEALRRTEAEARAAREAAEIQRVQIEADANVAKAKAESNQARADQEAADAKRLQSEAEVERAKAVAATAQADSERNQARADKEAAEARRNRAINWAIGVVAFVFLIIAAHTWLFAWPAIDSIDEFVQSKRDIDARQLSEFSSTDHAAVTELATLTQAAGKILEAQRGPLLLPEMWAASSLREETLRWPVLGAGFLQRLVDHVSSEPLVNGSMRNLLTTAVWDGGKNDTQPRKTPSWEEIDCKVVRSEKDREQTLHGKFLQGLQPGLAVFVPDVKDPSVDMAILSAQRVAPGQPCTGRYSFSVPGSLQPQFIFDADLSAMAVVAKGQATTLYDIEWSWDGTYSDGAMIARLPLRRVLTDPRAAQTFQGSVAASGAPAASNPAHALETRPVPGGLEVEVGKVWWRLLTTEARQLPTPAPDLSQGWEHLKPADKGSTCDVLGTWLARMDKQPAESSDPQHPDPTVYRDVMVAPGGTQCIALTRIDNRVRGSDTSAPTAGGFSAFPSEVVQAAVYHAVAVEAERRKAGGTDSPPVPFAIWRFGIQVPGLKRDWWVGKPGTDWDGWLAATPQGTMQNAVASPYATAALKRLADAIVAASPAASGSLPGVAAAPAGR